MISPKIEVKEKNGQKGIFAKKLIKKGEEIVKFEGRILEAPTRYTLQIDEGKHIESRGDIDDFLNHSCSPNSYVDFPSITLRALRDIKTGEEVTFNYLTTEWDMHTKFKCNCDNSNCFDYIKGFSYLTRNERKSIMPLVSPFLKSKVHY